MTSRTTFAFTDRGAATLAAVAEYIGVSEKECLDRLTRDLLETPDESDVFKSIIERARKSSTEETKRRSKVITERTKRKLRTISDRHKITRDRLVDSLLTESDSLLRDYDKKTTAFDKDTYHLMESRFAEYKNLRSDATFRLFDDHTDFEETEYSYWDDETNKRLFEQFDRYLAALGETPPHDS